MIKKIKKKITEIGYQNRPLSYLVKRWDGVSDINLLSNILGADPYNKEIIPLELDLIKISKALVISPHQDDESLGCGGTMKLMRNKDIPVVVYFTSDGTVISPPYADSDEEVAKIRFEEAKKVCDYLGAEMQILGIPDAKPRPTLEHLKKLSEKIWEHKDSAIFIPWLLDSPPKHRYLHHMLYLADKVFGLPDIYLYQYQVHNTVIPSHYVDISSVIDDKRTCLQFYESQNQHLRPYDHLGVCMSGWNSRLTPESKKCMYAEIFFKVSLKDNIKLVQKYFFKDLNRTYRGHSYLIQGLKDLEKEIKKKSR